MTRTKRELEVDRKEQALHRAIVQELRTQREDSGVSLSRLARAAGMTPGFLSKLEADDAHGSIHSYVALCHALGGDLRMRFEPGPGVPLRDRYQARMEEALLRLAHPRWKRFLEVAVHRPVRGVIDLVLHDPDTGDVVATETHSLIRRLEQQQRWANVKADSLIGGSELPLALPGGPPPRVAKLMLLRDTPPNRRLVSEFNATMKAAYPADPAVAFDALTGITPWPGSVLLWARVRGGSAAIVDPRRGRRQR